MEAMYFHMKEQFEPSSPSLTSAVLEVGLNLEGFHHLTTFQPAKTTAVLL
jgi:hypothetical protein